MATYDVTDFEAQVIARSAQLPVLVDFWAAWCGPCRMLGPVLERIASRHDGEWDLAKVDTEAFPDVAQRYGIRSIPNVKLFIDGRPVDEFSGALPEQAVEQWLARALPDRHGEQLAGADARFAALDFDGAASLYESVLQHAPDHEIARVRLAGAVLLHQPVRALELVGEVLPPGADGERADGIRTLGSLLERAEVGALPDGASRERCLAACASLRSGDLDEALDRFIDLLRIDRAYDDDIARRACIGMFKWLGEDHEVTVRHRREFDRAF